MDRIRRGFRFAGASWRIVRVEPSLVAFPVLSALFAILYTLLIVLPIGAVGFLALGDSSWLGWALLALLLLGASMGATFFGVAAAHNASEAMAGRDPTLGSGLRAAWGRKGVIAQWALVSATVGLVLQVLADRAGPIGGALIQGLGGLAWGIASFFALPILALEGLGPIATLKLSAATIRKRWGESLVGGAAIGLVTMLAALAAIGVIVLGALAVSNGGAPLGVPLIVIGIFALLAAMAIGQVLNAVFRVVVYRYATEGAVAPGFDEGDLERAFTPRGGRI